MNVGCLHTFVKSPPFCLRMMVTPRYLLVTFLFGSKKKGMIKTSRNTRGQSYLTAVRRTGKNFEVSIREVQNIIYAVSMKV